MSTPGQATIIRKKRRRRRRRTPIFPFVLLGLLILLGALGLRWLINRAPTTVNARVPSGYVSATTVFEQEYAKFFGVPIDDSNIRNRFDQASQAAGRGSMPGATSVLETLVKTAGVPVVFHNLGVGYSALGEYNRAADAFREALARDPEYPATRKLLTDLKGIPNGAAEPYTREQEPNNESSSANVIGLHSPVGGEIAGSDDSADYYKVIAPAAPRDLISIELANHSINFVARLRVYDSDLRILAWGDKTGGPGESVKVTGGPTPNSILYVAVSAEDNNGGLYLLTAKPEKAYDRYEPNDSILLGKRISIGEEVSANIMDAGDTDFFSFQSPRRGTVTIDIQNQSNTLIPALTMYNNDHRNLGFAQEVRKPGANVRYLLDADKDAVYYIQIAAQAGTAGAYRLRVD